MSVSCVSVLCQCLMSVQLLLLLLIVAQRVSKTAHRYLLQYRGLMIVLIVVTASLLPRISFVCVLAAIAVAAIAAAAVVVE
jgi:hypothetical protein